MPLLSIPAGGDRPCHVLEADSPAEIIVEGSDRKGQVMTHCRICCVRQDSWENAEGHSSPALGHLTHLNLSACGAN